MSKVFFAFLLVAVLAATNISSFQVSPVGVAASTRTASFSSAYDFSGSESTTSTSLNMVRVKVDPKDLKEERLNPAVFKNALYLGSVVVAVLLPVLFLIASSK